MIPDDVTNVLGGVLIAIVTAAGTVATARVKGRSDEKTSLSTNWAEFTSRIECRIKDLEEKVAELQAQNDEMRTVVHLKYPAALWVINRYREHHPNSPVCIAREIREDLDSI